MIYVVITAKSNVLSLIMWSPFTWFAFKRPMDKACLGRFGYLHLDPGCRPLSSSSVRSPTNLWEKPSQHWEWEKEGALMFFMAWSVRQEGVGCPPNGTETTSSVFQCTIKVYLKTMHSVLSLAHEAMGQAHSHLDTFGELSKQTIAFSSQTTVTIYTQLPLWKMIVRIHQEGRRDLFTGSSVQQCWLLSGLCGPHQMAAVSQGRRGRLSQNRWVWLVGAAASSKQQEKWCSWEGAKPSF